MSKKAKVITLVSAAAVLIASVFVVLAVLGVLPVGSKEDIRLGNKADVSWYTEDGKEFTITTVEEFYGLLELSNYYNFSGQTIKLGDDIVVNEGNAEEWKTKAPTNSWYPITGFAGTFDGQGHTIQGVYGKSVETAMGLFAETDKECVIKDFYLENSYFEVTGAGGCASISANGGGTFERIYSNATVNCRGHYGSGMIGRVQSDTTITECWYDGDIYALKRTSGGFVSFVERGKLVLEHSQFTGSLINDYADGGARTGGMIGHIYSGTMAEVTDCLSAGTLIGANTSGLGAIVGICGSGGSLKVNNSWSSMEGYTLWISPNGFNGTVTGAGIEIERPELNGYESYRWTDLDFDKYWAVVTDGLPVLQCFASDVPSVDGIEKGYSLDWYKSSESLYTLNTAEDLFGFYMISSGTNFEGKRVVLGNDITINTGNAKDWAEKRPQNAWRPIKQFSGIFDGNGHTISGLYVKTNAQKVGFFSETTVGSHVRNFRIENSYFENQWDAMAYTGSVAGRCRGSMDTIYSNAIIVSHGKENGGLIGVVDGKVPVTISNCWFDGKIELKGESGRYSGGLVGCVGAGSPTIQHCLNTGSITCEATKSGSHLGGLVGWTKGDTTTLKLVDVLNTGVITFQNKNQVGSAIGRIGTGSSVTFKDAYATQESHSVTVDLVDAATDTKKASVRQGNALVLPTSLLTGTKAAQWTNLDFERFWTVTKKGTPILKSFADAPISTSNVSKVFDTSWYNETASTYVLKDTKDLYGFFVVTGTTDFANKTVKLGANITVNSGNAADWAKTAPAMPWIPIAEFAGTFDGQGHTISGLYVDTTASKVGLFGETSLTSTVKNLRLTNSYFSTNPTGDAHIGSIAGKGNGTFDTIYSDAIVASTGKYAGGIVGRIDKKGTHKVANCWFDGSLQMSGDNGRYGGGIVGSVTAGNSVIENCLNTADISAGPASSGLHIGGIIGYVGNTDTVLDIKDTLNTGAMKPKMKEDQTKVNQVGSILGRIQAGSTVNLTNVYAMTGTYSKTIDTIDAATDTKPAAKLTGNVLEMSESLLEGYGAYKWTMLDFNKYWAVVMDGTPILKSFATTVPSLAGVEKLFDIGWYNENASVYTLNSMKDLYGVYVLSGSKDFAGKTIQLGKDIVVNTGNAADWGTNEPVYTWLAVKKFAGTFDGQGHTISGLYINANEVKVGLFAETTESATIKNLRLTNSYIKNASTTNSFTGSIVGSHAGKMDTVYSDAIMVCAGKDVGGLAGGTTGSGKHYITNCWFDGSLSMVGEDGRYAGGLLGTANGGTTIIENSLNTADISAEATKSGTHLGGFVASTKNKNTFLKIKDSLNTGRLTFANKNQVGSVLGRIQNDTTAEFENVFVTSESHTTMINLVDKATDTKAAGVQIGTPNAISEGNLLGVKAYQNTWLDFVSTWAAIEDETPILKAFVEFKGKTPMDLTNVLKPITDWFTTTKPSQDGKKYFTIRKLGELQGFAQLSLNNDFADWVITLGADIAINATDDFANWETNAPANTWVSIQKFAGTFDGQGHKISGLYINADEAKVGLFAETTESGTIKNLKLTDSYIKNAFTGNSFTGSIVGSHAGKMENVYSDAIMICAGKDVGGLAGGTTGSDKHYITNCWFDGSLAMVGEDGRYAGGLLGTANGGTTIIEHSLNTADISAEATKSGTHLGGFVGSTKNKNTVLKIKDSLNTGRLTFGNKNQVGSVLGRIQNDTTAEFEDVFVTSESHTTMINLIDAATSTKAAGKQIGAPTSIAEDKLLGEKAYQNTWLDFESTWAAIAGETPILQEFAEFKEKTPMDLTHVIRPVTSWFDTTEAGEDGKKRFTINTLGELQGFAQLSQQNNFAGWVITLGADISLNDVSQGQNATWSSTVAPENTWMPIGGNLSGLAFAGEFDGDGHTIKGIYVYATDNNGTGLFRATASGSYVHDFKLTDSYIGGSGRVVGSIAGQGHGTIENVYVGETVVEGKERMGGIVGQVNASSGWIIRACHFDGSLNVDGDDGAGGILGVAINSGNAGTMEYCLNTGTITSTSSGTTPVVGGLFGRVGSSGIVTFNNCINASTMHVTTIKNAGSIVGKGGSGTLYFNDTYGINGKSTYGEDDTPFDTAYYTQYSGATMYLNGTKLTLERPTTADLEAAIMVDAEDLYTNGAKASTLVADYWTLQDDALPILKGVSPQPPVTPTENNLLTTVLRLFRMI